jgi:hypothetical protein
MVVMIGLAAMALGRKGMVQGGQVVRTEKRNKKGNNAARGEQA